MKKYLYLLVALFVFTSLFFANYVFAVTDNITQINFITLPQTIYENTISDILTVETQNASGAEEQLDTSGTILNLTTTSSTGEFSSSATNWIPVSTLGMNKTWAHRNFYYKDSTPGVHTLTISAEGKNWSPAIQTITVSEVIEPDTTPPIITGIPADITTETNSDSGVNVSYVLPIATDVVDGVVLVNCSPVSGSLFPIGENIVNCSATDNAGNISSSSFKITILKENKPLVVAKKVTGSYIQKFSNPPVIPSVSKNVIQEPTKGEVLGIEKFNFTSDLYFGKRGSEVVELQKFLISKKFLKEGAFGGFFGKYTKEAVEKFQKANPPLWIDGIVGQQTRAVLNQ